MAHGLPVAQQKNSKTHSGRREQDRDRRCLEPAHAVTLADGAGEKSQRAR